MYKEKRSRRDCTCKQSSEEIQGNGHMLYTIPFSNEKKSSNISISSFIFFMQCNQFQHVESFIKLASEMTDSHKQCVCRMGFQTFLQITSMSNIDSIYFWLANHFNTTSCSIEMGNGFKFPITTSTVHKIFGMPIGGVHVITKPSEATYEFIKHELGTTSPTIEYLFSIINDELPEDKYCRIFILILVSLFVAPNSSGVVTKCSSWHRQYFTIWLVSAMSEQHGLFNQKSKTKQGKHQKVHSWRMQITYGGKLISHDKISLIFLFLCTNQFFVSDSHLSFFTKSVWILF